MAEPHIEIKLLKQEDVDFFRPEDKRMATCQGWSIWLNGKLVGIAGVSISRSIILAFSDFLPEALAVGKKTVWRYALILWDNIRSLGYRTMYAVADPRLPGAPALLKRLGFEYAMSSSAGEVYKWAS